MVSVVVPTKDRAQLLDQTLRSIGEQTRPPAAVIVADDGSTDDTAAVVERHGATLVRNAEGGWGAAGARNAGLERVETELVAFVDSDDLLLPGALAALADGLEGAADAPFAFGQGLSAARNGSGWTPHGLIHPEPAELGELFASIYVRNSVPSSGALVRTEHARAIGGYNADLEFVEDHDFWIRLAMRGDPVHVAEVVCVYRIHPENRHAPDQGRSDVLRVVFLMEGEPRLSEHVHDRIAVEQCEVAIAALKARRGREAWQRGGWLIRRPRYLRRAVRHFRDRRSWNREGAEIWRRRGELRDWLASY